MSCCTWKKKVLVIKDLIKSAQGGNWVDGLKKTDALIYRLEVNKMWINSVMGLQRGRRPILLA